MWKLSSNSTAPCLLCSGFLLVLLSRASLSATAAFTCSRPSTTTSTVARHAWVQHARTSSAQQEDSSPSSSSLPTTGSTRRELFQSLATISAALLVTTLPQAASADVDYSKIQDLLGPGGDYATTYAPPGDPALTGKGTQKRPTWLTEPTDEFKANEAKATEFKRQNLQKVAQFNKLLDAVGSVPNDETKLANTLDEVRRAIKQNGGLPIGITKDDVVKICRRRKAKKYWPTTVEVAYQDLILEIIYQQSPNTGRDMSKL